MAALAGAVFFGAEATAPAPDFFTVAGADPAPAALVFGVVFFTGAFFTGAFLAAAAERVGADFVPGRALAAAVFFFTVAFFAVAPAAVPDAVVRELAAFFVAAAIFPEAVFATLAARAATFLPIAPAALSGALFFFAPAPDDDFAGAGFPDDGLLGDRFAATFFAATLPLAAVLLAAVFLAAALPAAAPFGDGSATRFPAVFLVADLRAVVFAIRGSGGAGFCSAPLYQNHPAGAIESRCSGLRGEGSVTDPDRDRTGCPRPGSARRRRPRRRAPGADREGPRGRACRRRGRPRRRA